MSDVGLVGHWKLEESGDDSSGNGNHGHPLNVTYVEDPETGRRAARFDGSSSVITVNGVPLSGKDDFSLALSIRTDEMLDDVLGDLLSQYDADSRQGFTFGIQVAQGVTSHQPNFRQLSFGIDAGMKPVWRDCGRPGNSLYAMAMATYQGSLYTGTFETEEHESGHVYRYEGGQTWTDCGSPDRCNSASAMAVFDGQLYVGVSRYKASGSSLPDSPNQHPGGRVYRYDGGTEWIDCGALPDADSVVCLVVFKGSLYAIPLYSQGVFRYDGGTTWTNCGTPGRRLMSLTVFNGDLYAAGNEGGGVFRYVGGTEWEPCGFQEGMSQIYSFAVHYGRLHIGAWPEARVYEYDGSGGWNDRGLMGQEKETMGMMVYNGKLYAGTLPLAEVYRYDGNETWTRLQQLDMTPDVRYRRTWSMAVYNGRLYCGTLPSGRVFSMEAGKCVTHDRALEPGWRHVVATRSQKALKLYVDGKNVASIEDPALSQIDISNSRPFNIGFGPVDHFKGDLRDVRMYDRSLADSEVAALYQSEMGGIR